MSIRIMPTEPSTTADIGKGKADAYRRLSQSARPQGYRRGQRCHARSLACENRDRGSRSRQACLFAKAAHANAGRKPTDPQRRKKYNKQVFFVGTQQRSDRDRFLRAVNMVHKGLLGDIKQITVGINGGDVGGQFKKTKPPKELDWDFWLGQAPKVDYITDAATTNSAGGTNTRAASSPIGAPIMSTSPPGPSSKTRKGMGPIEIDGTDAKHPVPFKDGYPTVDDCYNTANDFAMKLQIRQRHRDARRQPQRERHSVRRARRAASSSAAARSPASRSKRTGTKTNSAPPISGGCTRASRSKGTRRTSTAASAKAACPFPTSSATCKTMNTCHLCSIAARFGRKIHWDPKAESIVGDPQAESLSSRKQREGYDIHRV